MDPANLGLRLLADQLLTLAEAKAPLVLSQSARFPRGSAADDPDLVRLALQEIRQRALRSQYLPEELFGEGGWSIMLNLFVANHEDRQVTVQSACIASRVPHTTAIRYIAFLVETGFVALCPRLRDVFASSLMLTLKGTSAMREVLSRHDHSELRHGYPD